MDTPKPKRKLLIGVLRERFAMWSFVDSLTYMFKFLDEKAIDWAMIGVRTTNIYKGREKLAEETLARDFTHLLFIDSDQTFVPATAQWLLDLDLPIVSGLIFQRSPPHLPCIYKRADGIESLPLAIELAAWFAKHEVPIEGAPAIMSDLSAEDSIWQVDECGTGCLMIKREVFETIPQPWFKGMQPVGTDLSFCRRVRQYGIPIYVDLRCQLGHVCEYQVTQADFRKTQKWRIADPLDLRDE